MATTGKQATVELKTCPILASCAIDLSVEFPNYTFSSSVRDLDIILDQALTSAPHLNRLSRDCFSQLRQLRTVARSLSSGAGATLVHSFITIHLDYCLSLYSGLPSVHLASLSRVLRSAARLIGQIPKFSHVSSYMLEVLHWLPIWQRIEQCFSNFLVSRTGNLECRSSAAFCK